MTQDESKHTVIIDADLHIQDPHDIILSYFNTNNDNQFAHGKKKDFFFRVLGLFVGLVLMKFFFEEMFTSFWVFLMILVIALIMGAIFAFAIPFFVKLIRFGSRGDGVRGIFYNVVFITLIVLLVGIFI
ncbi:hypothetical protein H6503_05665 [Candidatus Woesearchaeota archaeon]|nr:hypothetical protein [Candidatus Woesearchaeota archaeon]